VEATAAFERIASWAAAGQARMISELSRRRVGTSADFVADEVAVRLSTTGAVAEDKVALALGLHRLPMVADALATGDLDVRRATVTDSVTGVSASADRPEPSCRSAIWRGFAASTRTRLRRHLSS